MQEEGCPISHRLPDLEGADVQCGVLETGDDTAFGRRLAEPTSLVHAFTWVAFSSLAL